MMIDMKLSQSEDPIYYSSLVLFFLQFVLVGYLGVDFGYHWDEKPKILGPLLTSFENRSLLPGTYFYPSLLHELLIAYLFIKGLFVNSVRTDPMLLLELRQVMVLLCGLSIILTAVLVRSWRKSRFEALCAAGFLASSWEVGYHSRWLAVDGLMMLMATLTLWAIIRSFQSLRIVRWLALASFLAGLVAGAKYTGGLMLLPVLLAYGFQWRRDSLRNNAKNVMVLIGLFIGAFLLSTPGIIFDFETFRSHIFEQYRVYTTGHVGYTVESGMEHLLKMAQYFILVVPSHFVWLSVSLSGFCFLGIFDLLKEEWKRGVVFLSFPLIYFFYFGCHKVMIVRNLLVLIPFLMILAARGFSVFLNFIPPTNRRRNLGVVLLVFYLMVNGSWLFRAGISIWDRNRSNDLKQVGEYLNSQSDKLFVFGELKGELEASVYLVSSNITGTVGEDVSRVVLERSIATNNRDVSWVANHPFTFEKVFGSQEVNLNYYPTWKANDHIVIMTLENAANLKLY